VAAHGQGAGVDAAGLAQAGQHRVGDLGRGGAVGGPLAADQGQDGERPVRARGFERAQTMVAADGARDRAVAARQGPHAGIGEHHLLAPQRHVREDAREDGEEIVDLGLAAGYVVGIVGAQIGRAEQHPVAGEAVGEAGPPVEGLEIEHALLEGGGEPGVRDHEMRALGAADQPLLDAEPRVHTVGPSTGGVDDQARPDQEPLARRLVTQDDGAARHGSAATVQHSCPSRNRPARPAAPPLLAPRGRDRARPR
jgi:hypothetical protein